MLQDPLACTCFALRAATRRLTRRYDEALAPSGLGGSQFTLLNFVAAMPGCGVAELADLLDMDVSTATRNLRPLAAAGYLTLRAGSRDARRREVRLTPKGSSVLEKAHALWAKAQRETVNVFGKRRDQQLRALLAEVR